MQGIGAAVLAMMPQVGPRLGCAVAEPMIEWADELVDLRPGRSSSGHGAATPCLSKPPVTRPQQELPLSYIDGYVIAVQTVNKESYLEHARIAAALFKEAGATAVVENWGDDVPEGQLTSFPMAVQRKADETVVFSWTVWPSREVRNEGMKNLMTDPRLQAMAASMPFDGKRMIYGGFEMILNA
ncbi:hypothetical protein BH11PSE8_BH11PSE8_10470 [soil metagenome]